MPVYNTKDSFSPSGGVFAHQPWWAYPLGYFETKQTKDVYGIRAPNSISGVTHINGTPTDCFLYFFNMDMQLVDVISSTLDGEYETNNIYNDGYHYIVCLSKTDECPQITGKILPE